MSNDKVRSILREKFECSGDAVELSFVEQSQFCVQQSSKFKPNQNGFDRFYVDNIKYLNVFKCI